MEVRASLSRIVEEREMADVEKDFEGVEENLRNHQKMTKKELEQKNEELAYEREAALAKAVLFITRQLFTISMNRFASTMINIHLCGCQA